MSVTCIRNAAWMIGWDAAEGGTCICAMVMLPLTPTASPMLAVTMRGPVDVERDGAGMLVMPGLINAHNHPSGMPFYKSIREELANPKMYFTALYDGWRLFTPDPEDLHWGAQFAYCEMLLSGATSCVDMSFPYSRLD